MQCFNFHSQIQAAKGPEDDSETQKSVGNKISAYKMYVTVKFNFQP